MSRFTLSITDEDEKESSLQRSSDKQSKLGMEETIELTKSMSLNMKSFFDCKEVDGGSLSLDGSSECLTESCFLGWNTSQWTVPQSSSKLSSSDSEEHEDPWLSSSSEEMQARLIWLDVASSTSTLSPDTEIPKRSKQEAIGCVTFKMMYNYVYSSRSHFTKANTDYEFFFNQVGCNKYAIKFHYNNTYTIRCKVNHSIINVQCVLTFIHSNKDPKYDLKVVLIHVSHTPHNKFRVKLWTNTWL